MRLSSCCDAEIIGKGGGDEFLDHCSDCEDCVEGKDQTYDTDDEIRIDITNAQDGHDTFTAKGTNLEYALTNAIEQLGYGVYQKGV